MMDFKEGKIKGVIIEKLNKFYDERGFLARPLGWITYRMIYSR